MTFPDGENHPDYRFAKTTNNGQWGTYFPRKDDDFDRSAWEQRKAEREVRDLEIERQRLEKCLSPEQRDSEYRVILNQLTLSNVDRQYLESRGVLPEVIAHCRSVEKWQKLAHSIHINLPGANQYGNGLSNPWDGILVPIANHLGQFVGLRLHDPNNKTTGNPKYIWLSSQKRGVTPNLPNGELPAGTHYPNEITKPGVIGLCEGMEWKAPTAAQKLGFPVMGFSGHNAIANSPQQIQATINYCAQLWGMNPKEITLSPIPDGNCLTNESVNKSLTTAIKDWENHDYTVEIAWWGQSPDLGDIDEISPDIAIEFIPSAQFLASSPVNKKEDKVSLKIAIKAYIAEKDPYKRDEMLTGFYKQGLSDRRINNLVSYETAASSTQRSNRFKPSDFRTLASEGKKWLIPGLMASTGVTLLTAPPGGFKTTFAFDLAGSVINGTSFMGEPIKENGPVVFACSDEPITEAQERATMQGFIHSEDYEYLDNWNLGQLDLLEESIADLRPKLVIVDSFDSIHRDSGHDENATGSSMAIKKLNELAKKYSTQILVIHHENKDPKLSGVNKARGSSAIVAAANAHIRLLPVPSESERVIVTIEKMRGGSTRKILCDIDFYNVRFEPEVNLEWEQQAGQRDIILSFLQSNPGKWFEVGELNQYLGWTGKGIYKPLKQLSNHGEIQIKPNCKGRKGMVYRFPCTGDSEDDQPPTPPSLSTETPKENNTVETLTHQGLEDSHLLVTSWSPLSHLLVTDTVTSTEDIKAETLTQTDSHLVTSEGGTLEGGGLDDQTLPESVPPTKTEVITTDPCSFAVPEGSANDFPINDQDWPEAKAINDAQLSTLGWDFETAQEHLMSKFGVTSRKGLTYGQFWEWVNYCGEFSQ